MENSELLKMQVYKHNNANPYADVSPFALAVGFPVMNYKGFFPEEGEVLIYAVRAATFKDKERVVGYTGKSAGMSVRVAKGVSIRTGSSGGNPIRSDVRKFNYGDLLVTNKRILFIGKDDNFDFKVGKISNLKLLDEDSLIIQSGRSSRNIFFGSDLIFFPFAIMNYVLEETGNGTDLYKLVTETSPTAEQLEMCNKLKEESAAIIPQPPATNKKKKHSPLVTGLSIFFGFFAVAMMMALIVIIASVALDSIHGDSHYEDMLFKSSPSQIETY